jgi:hypothetical protein
MYTLQHTNICLNNLLIYLQFNYGNVHITSIKVEEKIKEQSMQADILCLYIFEPACIADNSDDKMIL